MDSNKATGRISAILAALMIIIMLPMMAFAVNESQNINVYNGIEFKKWTSTSTLPSASGNYYLSSDVTISTTWVIPDERTIGIDLRGHTIKMAGGKTAVAINGGGTFNMYDSEDKGRITGGKGSYSNDKNGGGGVYVSGTFNMYGGEISGNTAKGSGGGILNMNTVNIMGGRIINNVAGTYGGAISNNGRVAGLDQNGIGRISNCIITGNSAKYGGGIHNGYRTILGDNVVVKNNTASSLGGGMSGYGEWGYQEAGQATFNGKNILITENICTASAALNNVALQSGYYLDVDSDLEGSIIEFGIFTTKNAETTGRVTNGYIKNNAGASIREHFILNTAKSNYEQVWGNLTSVTNSDKQEIWVAVHNHKWSYLEKNGDTIEAYCTNNASVCPYYGTATSHPDTVKLIVGASDSLYNEKPYSGAVITDELSAVTDAVVSIRYSSTDGGGYSNATAPTDVGSYKVEVTVTATDNKTYKAEKAFKITPIYITDDDVALSSTHFWFDNTEKSPTVTVKKNVGETERQLNSITEYTLTGDIAKADICQNGEYTVTVKGIGNFAGSVNKTWRIEEMLTYLAEVTPDGKDFGKASSTYGKVSAERFTIESKGTGELSNITVTLAGDDADRFILDTSQTALLLSSAGGGNNSTEFTVTPKENLSYGSYSATVLINADGMEEIKKTVAFRVEPIAPTIITNPSDVTIYEGQTAEFAVTAYGDPLPTYQWQSDDGNGFIDIDGATEPSYSIADAALSLDGLQLRCIATNGVGDAAVSDIATLTVKPFTHIISLDSTDNKPIAETVTGYDGKTPYNVIVRNSGTGATGELIVELSGESRSRFTLSRTSIQSLNVGESDSFILTPNADLQEGVYTATITVKGDLVEPQAFNISFTVEPVKLAEEEPVDPKPTTPSTGDDNSPLIWFVLLVLSGADIFLAILYIKKKRA